MILLSSTLKFPRQKRCVVVLNKSDANARGVVYFVRSLSCVTMIFATQVMAPREQGTFVVTLQGSQVACSYTVHHDYAVALEFNLRGKPYSFRLTKWKQKGQATFMPLFFNHCARDQAAFGTLTYSADMLPSYQQTEAQHVAVVVQATKDVMLCLDQIVHAFERSVLDYAVHYREKHQETDTYAQYITLVCCHCITHSDFLAPQVTWPLLQFQG